MGVKVDEFQKIRPVKHLAPLPNGVVSLYEMQGFWDYKGAFDKDGKSPYDVATHYLTIKDENNAKNLNRPSARTAVNLRLKQRKGGCVYDWVVVYVNGEPTYWYVVTSAHHIKSMGNDWASAWFTGRNSSRNARLKPYSHLVSGEPIFFVYQKPMPDEPYEVLDWPERHSWL